MDDAKDPPDDLEPSPAPQLFDDAGEVAVDAVATRTESADEPMPEPLRPSGAPVILAGTASWTDPGLIKCGRFYPKGCSSAEERLRYYATRFSMVEVNSSYYALPSRSNSELWVERTPADFNFNVKAF